MNRIISKAIALAVVVILLMRWLSFGNEPPTFWVALIFLDYMLILAIELITLIEKRMERIERERRLSEFKRTNP